MSETRMPALIVKVRRELHPDAKPFSTYIIAAVAEQAREWAEYTIQHWGDEKVRQVGLEEMQFYFDTIRYIRDRMDHINSPLLSVSQR